MHFGTLEVTAPQTFDEEFNEAEVFGTVVWLLMHSKSDRDIPLHALSALVLPPIKYRQFVLASEDGKPVFYLSWANLNEESEGRYLKNPPVCMREGDWNSGDRMWILDWVAPFGHSYRITRLLERHIFANRCARSLYHRGDEKGLRFMTFHGIAVLKQVARHWFDTHPVALDQNQQMQGLASPTASPDTLN